MNEAKIFGIGFSKTGTTSLGNALESLGYQVCNKNLGDYDNDIVETLTERADDAVNSFDAFQDCPWCGLYERYSSRFPEAKFVLTVRDLAKWLNSMDAFGEKQIPIWGPVYGRTCYRGNEDYFRDLYLRHIKNVVDHFKGQPGRLLILNIESDPGYLMRTLEGFLGIGYSGHSFPSSNVSRRNRVRWAIHGRKWRRLASGN